MATDAPEASAAGAAGAADAASDIASSIPMLPSFEGSDLYGTAPVSPLSLSLFDIQSFPSPKKRSADAAGLDDVAVRCVADENAALRAFASTFKTTIPIQPCARCENDVYPMRECCGEKYCGMCDGICVHCHSEAVPIVIPPTCIPMTCPNRVHGCPAMAMCPLPLVGLMKKDVSFLDVHTYAAKNACADLERLHTNCQFNMVFTACTLHQHIKKVDVIHTLSTCEHCAGGVTAQYFSKLKKLLDSVKESGSDDIKTAVDEFLSSA